MKSISRFLTWASLETVGKIPFTVMLLVNDMRVALARAGVNPDGIFTSIHSNSMGLTFEMWGEIG